MSKLYALLLLFISSLSSFSQCVPNANLPNSQLYSPTPQEGLKRGAVGLFYESTLTVNVPKDTVYQNFNVEVDSITLVDIVGLPPNFSYDCSTPNCVFFGGELSCVSFSGLTNDSQAAKVWALTAIFDFKLRSGFIPIPLTDSVTDYNIDLTLYPASVSGFLESDPAFYQDFSQRGLSLYADLIPEDYTLEVYSMLGELKYSENGVGVAERIKFDLSSAQFSSGIYIAVLQQAHYQRTIRVILN